MAKKIDYASMYTLRKDGLYMGYWHDSKGTRHSVYDRDPEKLYLKIQEKESPTEPTFADIANAWHDKVWDSYRAGTLACYASIYQRTLDEQKERNASEITAADVAAHMQKLANEQLSAKSVKTLRTIYKLIYQNAIIDDYFSNWVTVNPAALTARSAVYFPLDSSAAAALLFCFGLSYQAMPAFAGTGQPVGVQRNPECQIRDY